MTKRLLIAALGVVCLGACAGEPSTRVLGYQGPAASLSPITTATAAPTDAQPMKRTMASRVLAARALERVTGRKPDPARLASLD